MEEERPSQEMILNIRGAKVGLGPLRRDLLPVYTNWFNDFEVTRTMGRPVAPITREAEEDWYDRASRALIHETVYFTIFDLRTMKAVGTTSLFGINNAHRTAEFGIVIGDKTCWGQGYGTEAVRLMLDYGFHALDLHNIILTVHATNERAIRAYRSAGFREIGRRRESVRGVGGVQDTLYMDCLATEFESPVFANWITADPG